MFWRVVWVVSLGFGCFLNNSVLSMFLALINAASCPSFRYHLYCKVCRVIFASASECFGLLHILLALTNRLYGMLSFWYFR